MRFFISDKEEQSYRWFHSPNQFNILDWTGASEVFAQVPGYDGVHAAWMVGYSEAMLSYNCTYVRVEISSEYTVKATGDMEDLNLPCEIGAAFSTPDGKLTFLVKDSTVYSWYHGDPENESVETRDIKQQWPFLANLDICGYE